MADFMVHCARNPSDALAAEILEQINSRITPDNVRVSDPVVTSRGNCMAVVFDPINEGAVSDYSITLGNFESGLDNIDNCISSYAYCELNETGILLKADTYASRTIWYYHDEDVFLASTSQRAIVIALGRFQFNAIAAYLLVHTGNLGCGYSWDSAIRSCRPCESIQFDAKSWDTDHAIGHRTGFTTKPVRDSQQRAALEDAFNSTFGKFDIDFDRAVLPISGGYDSRYLLLRLLDNKHKPRTITWGHPDSPKDPKNDAHIAQILTETLGVEHEFLPTFTSEESLADRMDRFLRLGEGRVENVNAYLDGFALWKNLREGGVTGVIRGDECFGWMHVVSEKDVLHSTDLLHGENWNSIDMLDKLIERQTVPLAEFGYARQHGESIPTWRDRLYQDHMVPTFYAALNYTKSKYLEVYTPYYSRPIFEAMRSLSDGNRTGKSMFRKIVHDRFSDVPIADNPANIGFSNLFQLPEYVDLVSATLDRGKETSPFKREGLDRLKTQINRKPEAETPASMNIKDLIPRWVKDLIIKSGYYHQPFTIDSGTLSLRVFITLKIIDLFEQDAAVGSNNQP